SLVALPVAVIGGGALGLGACGSTSPSTTAMDSGTPMALPGQPPPRPAAPMTGFSTERNFAMREVFLGDADRSYKSDSSAWQSFGFNIDGKITTKDSTDVCTAGGSATSPVHQNPPNGIDNAFGMRIVPLLRLAAQNGLSRDLSD